MRPTIKKMFLWSSNEAIIRKSINLMHKIIGIAGTIRVLFEEGSYQRKYSIYVKK